MTVLPSLSCETNLQIVLSEVITLSRFLQTSDFAVILLLKTIATRIHTRMLEQIRIGHSLSDHGMPLSIQVTIHRPMNLSLRELVLPRSIDFLDTIDGGSGR